ncbi:MAG: hypothetical protein GAK30_03345 [Paracidovorax wautersii]|uniref:DUF4390 domain-containing protein n=1 Tax=Paracidovorax wautersii TaxID=1177982 RepID=A0A7V8FLE7_9BURK|nr:MAG: hypothetical protein GAK30_03345 [Paracidovorax wautersii]
MVRVSMTAFITHCWKKCRLSAGLAALTAVFWLGVWAPPAQAQEMRAGTIRVMEASLQAREAAVTLSANMNIALPELAEEALHKGIPLFFVAQARVVQPRWYWTDAVVADVQRFYRLSYQPLTDRWRLSISAERLQPGGGLALGQNFDSLADALAVLRRIPDWRVGSAGDFSPGSVYTVEFGFRLDVSQLPRPLQIGMTGQENWRFGAQVEFRWAAPAPASVPAPAAVPASEPPAGAER